MRQGAALSGMQGKALQAHHTGSTSPHPQCGRRHATPDFGGHHITSTGDGGRDHTPHHTTSQWGGTTPHPHSGGHHAMPHLDGATSRPPGKGNPTPQGIKPQGCGTTSHPQGAAHVTPPKGRGEDTTHNII